MSEEAIKIFYSYSRKDLDMRNTLEDHLSALREANRITTWHDLELEAGTEWEPVILNKLDTADIILLLVSSNFIASRYCYGIELKRAIARHNEGTARVIPIILRPCDWNYPDVPFSKLNVLPTHAKAIASWADPDEAFTIVAQRVRETVDQLRAKKINELASEKKVDYTRLRDLLKAGQWEKADRETAARMCEVMVRQQEGWLRVEDIQSFPCTDLRTIDQLWVQYSSGRFGFSVQRQIWVEVGESYSKLGDRVGWRVSKTTVHERGVLWTRRLVEREREEWLSFSNQLTFSLDAPIGHLPRSVCEELWVRFRGDGAEQVWVVWEGYEALFSTVNTCKL